MIKQQQDRLSFTVSDAMREKVILAAESEELSISDIIRRALRSYFEGAAV